MTTLLVGFDSAWTPTKSGALVGVLRLPNVTFRGLGPPQIANFCKAKDVIREWQVKEKPTATLVLLDQPSIVINATGQRPVENIVGAVVGRRYGGMQPANKSKEAMFGEDAPIWPFLNQFGGPADPLGPVADTLVIETYPVLTMIALLWMLPDEHRSTGRLPKYNPERKKTFLISDWRHVCEKASVAFRERGLMEIVAWVDRAREKSPHKSDQDGLDACLCLLVALYLAEGKDCLKVGDQETGYIVVPHDADLRAELDARCIRTGRVPSKWVKMFRLRRKESYG